MPDTARSGRAHPSHVQRRCPISGVAWSAAPAQEPDAIPADEPDGPVHRPYRRPCCPVRFARLASASRSIAATCRGPRTSCCRRRGWQSSSTDASGTDAPTMGLCRATPTRRKVWGRATSVPQQAAKGGRGRSRSLNSRRLLACGSDCSGWSQDTESAPSQAGYFLNPHISRCPTDAAGPIVYV
jgi:hypothetical protein